MVSEAGDGAGSGDVCEYRDTRVAAPEWRTLGAESNPAGDDRPRRLGLTRRRPEGEAALDGDERVARAGYVPDVGGERVARREPRGGERAFDLGLRHAALPAQAGPVLEVCEDDAERAQRPGVVRRRERR